MTFFHDDHGRLAVFQFPNVPLIGWFVCWVIAMPLPAGPFKAGFSKLSLAFLFTWAYLEIVRGSSYFRQIIGAIVMIGVLVGFFSR